MKRILFVLLLSLLVIALPVCADLFPGLTAPTPMPELDKNKVPSYGAMANADPFETYPYPEGGQVVTYHFVSRESFDEFLGYLEGYGYTVTDSSVDDENRVYEYLYSDDVNTIGVVYRENGEELLLIYEESAEYALKTPWEGYKRIELGQDLEIKGLGTFTFTGVHLGERIRNKKTNAYSNSWISFDFYNKSTEDKAFTWLYRNDLFSCIFGYSNSDDDYQFENSGRGNLFGGEIGEGNIPVLETDTLVVSFNLPNGALQSTDGFLYMLMDFPAGEKYVLVLRDQGEKVGEW